MPGVESLDYFQASLSFLLGFGSPDPDNTATFGIRWVFIENHFHHLAAPEIKTPAHSKAFIRGIEDETGQPLRYAVQIDNHAGASFRLHALRPAKRKPRKARHSFINGSTK